MKTALDLPDDLVKEVKIYAVRQGRKLKDVMADLLRRGLDASYEPAALALSPIATDPRTGLPTVSCNHPAAGGQQLTPNRIAEILLDQDVAWSHEALR